MSDKFIDPKTKKELFKINDSNEESFSEDYKKKIKKIKKLKDETDGTSDNNDGRSRARETDPPEGSRLQGM